MHRKTCARTIWNLQAGMAWSVVIVLVVWYCFCTLACNGQSTPSTNSKTQSASAGAATDEEEPEDEVTITPGEVIIEGRHILKVYEPIAGLSPQERAERIADRIVIVAQEGSVSPESVGTQ